VQQFPAFTVTEFQNGVIHLLERLPKLYLMSCNH